METIKRQTWASCGRSPRGPKSRVRGS